MSGVRRFLPAYKGIDAGDMSGAIVGPSTNVAFIDNITLVAEWAGSAPVGQVDVQVQNGNSAWSTLTLTPAFAISGASGNANAQITLGGFEKMRVIYTATSGTGTLTVWVAGKGI